MPGSRSSCSVSVFPESEPAPTFDRHLQPQRIGDKPVRQPPRFLHAASTPREPSPNPMQCAEYFRSPPCQFSNGSRSETYMTTKYIHAALPLILSLMATTAQAMPTQAAAARPIDGIAPAWSVACTRNTGQTECKEPMSVYGRPFALSRGNAEARAEIRGAERSFASHVPAPRSRDRDAEDPFASMHFE